MWHACGESLYRDNPKVGHDLENLGLDGKIILKWFSDNNVGKYALGFSVSGLGEILCSC
jgi:hypothetical protein